jgi:peptidoglycan LD-endopeptidase CwlK
VDSVSENRLCGIYPELAEKVRQIASVLEEQGVVIRIVQSLRTWSEQDVLYSLGRDASGHVVNRSAVVTNCPGGKSYHNFGLAVDCVPSDRGPGFPFDPDWNSGHDVWKKMVSAGLAVGLDSGATWRTFHDFPHFQLTGRFPENEPSPEVHEFYQRGGIQAVWDEVIKSLVPASS